MGKLEFGRKQSPGTSQVVSRDLEFVFGPYETYQVPVREIERQTSLDFHFLTDRDPLGGLERLEGAPPPGHLVETVGDLVL